MAGLIMRLAIVSRAGAETHWHGALPLITLSPYDIVTVTRQETGATRHLKKGSK
jgi:hypothetical protein